MLREKSLSLSLSLFLAFHEVKVPATETKGFSRVHLTSAKSQSLKRIAYRYTRGTTGVIGRTIGYLCDGALYGGLDIFL
jgi:hypothetical protein